MDDPAGVPYFGTTFPVWLLPINSAREPGPAPNSNSIAVMLPVAVLYRQGKISESLHCNFQREISSEVHLVFYDGSVDREA